MQRSRRPVNLTCSAPGAGTNTYVVDRHCCMDCKQKRHTNPLESRLVIATRDEGQPLEGLKQLNVVTQVKVIKATSSTLVLDVEGAASAPGPRSHGLQNQAKKY